MAIARAVLNEAAEWRSADGSGLDAALGVKDLAFDVIVVGGQGGLGGFV